MANDKKDDKSTVKLSELDFSTVISEDEVTEITEKVVDLEKLIPSDILKWIKGEADQPAEIRKLGEDISSKLNWFIVYVILAQYSRIPTLFQYLSKAETALYNTEKDFKESGKKINTNDLKLKYAKATEELTNVLEFARKFTLQNKDILSGSELSPEDKMLLDKIRGLTPDQVTKVIEKVNEVIAEDAEKEEVEKE